jgi:M6 family metalloprotease-like protein
MKSIPIKGVTMKLRRLTLLVYLLTLMVVVVNAQPTLQDFGYQNLKINGQLATGHRPLLVMIATFDGQPTLAHSVGYFDSLIFPLFGTQSANGYFLEVSNGRFFWSRTPLGIVGPVDFSAEEFNAYHLDDPVGISYIFKEVVRRRSLNLAQFDDNSDGTVSQDELGILILHNQGDGLGGAARAIDPTGCLTPEGSSVQICGGNNRVTTVGHRASFMTLCHEISHQLGTLDLYGCCSLNQDVTLMGGTIYPNQDDRRTYHLDPWHKMQLGWSEPRIRSLRSGGVESIPAVQTIRVDAPLILYDGTRNTGEYFIIEYRTQSTPNGTGYDRNVAGNGLAIWHVKQDANKSPVPIPGVTLYAVFLDGAPNFARGGNTLWASQTTTPYLQWLDNSQTLTNVFVRPFAVGDGSITVEWLTNEETWIDFNFRGAPELGTFDNPFNTLTEGLNAVSYGGILRIKAGSSSEAPTISKRMRIEAYGGTVTIGQ